MLSRILAVFALTTTLVSASTEAIAAKSCTADSDCKGSEAACLAGTCKKLSEYESLLRVVLSNAYYGVANLYIDGTYMGDLPWEGIVSAGTHSIKVEAQGMMPASFQGLSVGMKADTVSVTLEPMPQAPPIPAGAPAAAPADEDSDLPGTFHAGLYGGGNYGTGSWEGSWKRPVAGVQGGLALGLRAIPDPVWLDLSLVFSSTSLKVFDDEPLDDGKPPDWGDFLKLHFGLQVRLLFPVKKNFFYVGAELEPGYGLSGARWMYVDLHLAMSLFLNQFVEIRINPIGMEYLQELQFRGYIASFHATIGIAIRFPRKRVF